MSLEGHPSPPQPVRNGRHSLPCMQKSTCLTNATRKGKCQGRASTVGCRQGTADTCDTCRERTACPPCTVQINPCTSWGRPRLSLTAHRDSNPAPGPLAQPTTRQVKVLLFLRAFPLSSSRAGRKRFWVGRNNAGAQEEFSRSTGTSDISHSRPGQVMDGVWGDQYFPGGLSGLSSHLPHSFLLQPHQPVDPMCISFVTPTCPLPCPPRLLTASRIPLNAPRELPSRAHVFVGMI